MNSPKKTARIAGLLYLAVIIFGVFAEMYVRGTLIIRGDAATTANNIMASETLFRFGFISDLIMITIYLFLAFTLYVLLKSVSNNAALLFVLLSLASIAVMTINMLNQFAALILLSGADYLTVFETSQLNGLAMLFLDFHKYGYFIAQIFFGLWLLPLGYLLYKSDYFPKILGVLVMVATFGHLIEFFQVFLLPDYEAISYPGLAVATIGEFSLCLWLLVKGVKARPPGESHQSLVTARV